VNLQTLPNWRWRIILRWTSEVWRVNVSTTFLKVIVEDDQKVSVNLMMYCNRQVHRDVLITL